MSSWNKACCLFLCPEERKKLLFNIAKQTKQRTPTTKRIVAASKKIKKDLQQETFQKLWLKTFHF